MNAIEAFQIPTAEMIKYELVNESLAALIYCTYGHVGDVWFL